MTPFDSRPRANHAPLADAREPAVPVVADAATDCPGERDAAGSLSAQDMEACYRMAEAAVFGIGAEDEWPGIEPGPGERLF